MKSYTSGPSLPLVDHTVADLLERAAGDSPEVPAVISRHQGLRITYAELYAVAGCIAAGLYEVGLRPGDRVGIWAANCAEWIYVQYAAARLGLVLVNVNPACRSHDLAYILARSQIKALFLHERDDRVDYTGVLAAARCGPATPLVHTIPFESDLWQSLVRTAELRINVPFRADDIVNIQYTSGTTGGPKGVMLSHRNVINNTWILARELGITSQDRLCAPVPLHHCFGYVVSSLLAVAARIPLYLPASFFDPSATMKTIQEERCTVLHGVPTMFLAYLTHPDFPKYDLTSLRTGIVAGALFSAELMNRYPRPAVHRCHNCLWPNRVLAGHYHVLGRRA
jgi:fatty-acyl-CoA synthase